MPNSSLRAKWARNPLPDPTSALLTVWLVLGVAAPVAAATLALPVLLPGQRFTEPCYTGESFEVQLAPAAARLAHPRGAGRTRAIATSSLGVPALDAVALRLGATFTPEFQGELAPEPGHHGVDFTSFHLVHLPPGAVLEDALAEFRALPEVVSVSPLAILPTSIIPNDSLFSAETWLYDPGTPRHDIHAPEAWAQTWGDTSVVIAILDTGVLEGHPDLGGKVAGLRGNLWTNWAEKGGLPGVDDDGNGFVDDVHGWDFVTGGTAGGIYGATGEDVDDEDNDPNDFCGHGTIVAGIAGAITNNASGIAGVAPTVRLMPVRMGWLPEGSSRPNGAVRMDFAAQAIRYATLMHANVINCSWASAETAGLDSAVAEANTAGSIIVVASGNYSSPNYLATRSDVIAVGATDETDAYWGGTETGPWLDLVARGTNMTSTYLQTTSADSLGYRQPAYVSGVTGTSVAAPVVSGAAAMVQAYLRSQGMNPLNPWSMRTRLQQTGDDVSAANPGQPYLVPRVNLYRAMTDPGLVSVAAGPAHAALALAPRSQPSRGPVTLDWSLGFAPLGPVTLEVHDVAGRRLGGVSLTAATRGSWTWDGRDAAGGAVPAGMYFARLACGSSHSEARVVMLR
jgi:subtilisin family serine protease